MVLPSNLSWLINLSFSSHFHQFLGLLGQWTTTFVDKKKKITKAYQLWESADVKSACRAAFLRKHHINFWASESCLFFFFFSPSSRLELGVCVCVWGVISLASSSHKIAVTMPCLLCYSKINVLSQGPHLKTSLCYVRSWIQRLRNQMWSFWGD